MATVEDASAIFATLHKRDMDAAIRGAVDRGTKRAARLCKSRYFVSGGKPRRGVIVSRTGRLKRSVKYVKARRRGWGPIVGGIKMGGRRLPQARILELGGRTRPHLIAAKRANTLAFFWEKIGQWVFPKFVRHPGSVFEPRAVLGRALQAEYMPRIIRGVKRAMAKVVRERLRK